MLEMSEQSGKSRLARRAFLATSGAGLAGLAFWLATPHPGEAAGPAMVSIVMFSNAGVREKVVSLPKVVKSDAAWRKQLGYDSFEVTRHGDTERPFTGALLNEHKKGIFCCICCDTAVFSSDTKFESGTGWPSFWAPIAKENIVETTDTGFGMIRTAISCRLCDAHLGHVFDDGPKPTGLRYCMNSVALKFAKA